MADGGLAAQDAAAGDLFALCATYADADAADLADKAIINLMALDAAGSWNVDHGLLLIGLNFSFKICTTATSKWSITGIPAFISVTTSCSDPVPCCSALCAGTYCGS